MVVYRYAAATALTACSQIGHFSFFSSKRRAHALQNRVWPHGRSIVSASCVAHEAHDGVAASSTAGVTATTTRRANRGLMHQPAMAHTGSQETHPLTIRQAANAAPNPTVHITMICMMSNSCRITMLSMLMPSSIPEPLDPQ